MKDFENDLIYYPNPDPVKEPRFILNSVDELEKSAKYSVCLLYTSQNNGSHQYTGSDIPHLMVGSASPRSVEGSCLMISAFCKQ